MDSFDRRGFLKAGAVALWQAAAPAQTQSPARAPLRRILPLNRKWLFGGRAVPGCSAADFDDSHFQHVTIPHSNKIFPWHSFDEKDFQFVSIYRRHFNLTPPKGRRVFVDFAGVMTAAAVAINGHKLGEYRGGYTPFSFELTPHLNANGSNVLAVEVDSTERPDIPPFGENIDYLTFGGIYREVALRIVPPKSTSRTCFAKPVDVLEGDSRRVEVKCPLDGQATPMRHTAESGTARRRARPGER
jgi:beta-galactosidase